MTSNTCRCRIALTKEGVLSEGGEEFGGTTLAMVQARDSRGRYYVRNNLQPHLLLLYDSAGRFLRTIGNKGSGPGEFTNIWQYFVGTGDTLHVFDQGTRSYTALSPSFSVVRTAFVGARINGVAELLPGLMVLSAHLRTRTRFGVPLHLFDGRELKRGIGNVLGEANTPDELELNRKVAANGTSAFWTVGFSASEENAYLVEMWDTAGRLMKRFRRTAPMFRFASDKTAEGMLKPVLRAAQFDGAGRLWVAISVRDQRWKDAVEEIGKWPDGRPMIRNK